MTISNDLAKSAKVIYILPGLGVGGVETALGRSYGDITNVIDLQIWTLDRYVENIQGIPSTKVTLRHLLHLMRQRRDQIIVTSLWRAHLVGLLLKCIGFPWVAFFHNPAKGHFINRLVCVFSSKVADFCFFDSQRSANGFFGRRKLPSFSIIPFIFPSTLNDTGSGRLVSRDIDIAFVGRLVELKRIDLLIALTEHCIELNPNFKVGIAGAGQLEKSIADFFKRHPNNVMFLGSIDNLSARLLMRRSKFIACLSDYEGMAMAVVEGIQEGCVPVVRLVGEIANYVSINSAVICHENLNLLDVAHEVVVKAGNPEILREMNNRSRANLVQYKSYPETFVSSILDVNAKCIKHKG
jgi:glycosyltransferase involved in cell wall biosynthesis